MPGTSRVYRRASLSAELAPATGGIRAGAMTTPPAPMLGVMGRAPGQPNSSPSWVTSKGSTCTSCHGAPPPAPHPQLTNCSHCHADVVASDNTTIINRMRHVDGIVDTNFDQSCTSCHGGKNPAPPLDVTGHDATTFAGVGAHQAHLGASERARAVPCTECHVVPKDVLAVGHIDTALPAEVTFSGVALAFDATPVYQAGSCRGTPCHGGDFSRYPPVGRHQHRSRMDQGRRQPSFTCGSCHGLPATGTASVPEQLQPVPRRYRGRQRELRSSGAARRRHRDVHRAVMAADDTLLRSSSGAYRTSGTKRSGARPGNASFYQRGS